ncbi:SpoIIE family protein phosphatase, partial [Clostridium perfringens]|nr:SpoIIE family protein phosphatase [Clostridium perfringens]
VGMFSQLVIEARTITCSTNYRLGLYTDGLIEAAAGELEQAVALLSEYIKQETSVDSQAWQELFRRPSAREDDICLVWAQVSKCYKY